MNKECGLKFACSSRVTDVAIKKEICLSKDGDHGGILVFPPFHDQKPIFSGMPNTYVKRKKKQRGKGKFVFSFFLFPSFCSKSFCVDMSWGAAVQIKESLTMFFVYE